MRLTINSIFNYSKTASFMCLLINNYINYFTYILFYIRYCFINVIRLKGITTLLFRNSINHRLHMRQEKIIINMPTSSMPLIVLRNIIPNHHHCYTKHKGLIFHLCTKPHSHLEYILVSHTFFVQNHSLHEALHQDK